MDEQPETVTAPGEEPGTPAPDVVRQRTGVGHVDAVLASMEQLDDLPVEEHAAVFERAHDQLRRALDGDGNRDQVDPAGPDSAPLAERPSG